MASSDNQGLQITMIVFIILTVLLSATTFYFFRQWDEVSVRLTAETADKTKAQGEVRKAVDDMNQMRDWIGVGPDAAAGAGTASGGLEALRTTFDEDMSKFAATLPEDKRRYRDSLQSLFDELATVNQRLREEQSRVQDLMDKHQAREAAKDTQIQEHVTAVEATRAELAAERAKFSEDVARITADNEALKAKSNELQTELDTMRDQLATRTKETESQTRVYEARIDALNKRIAAITTQTFEVADGEIVRVDLARKVVWINLGSDDYVRPQISFSVWSTDANDVARTEPKGRIEVSQVLGPKLSAARIIDDELSDPMGSGDKIYTPSWHPGRQEHFALAGLLDIDGDGRSDRQAVRDLIALAGGVVDAELTDDGKRTGEMTLDTRYLVRGDDPSGEVLKPFTEMLRDANQIGAETITLEKFLDHVGWSDPKRLIDYQNNRAGALPLPHRARPPVSNGNVTDLFRRRTPPRPAGNSAY